MNVVSAAAVAALSFILRSPAMPEDSPSHARVDVDVPVIREGLAFRGAAVPFGMTMFGPNVPEEGYSLFTLQGAEVGGDFIGHVPFRPTILPLDKAAKAPGVPSRNPRGAPGYFHDVLEDGIEVELTAGRRTGMARFTFPPQGSRCVKIGTQQWLHEVGSRQIQGFHQKGLGYKVYFVAEFDHDVADTRGGVLDFGSDVRVLQMKVGVSYTSEGNALANLRRENPGWDFYGVRRKAGRAWDRVLGRIKVEGGTEARRSLFATCLYRCILQPNVYSDANGAYLGFDGAARFSPNGYRYANYSVWDTYRTWVQLVAWLDPKTVSDMMETLVDAARCGGGAMPRWATANVETGIMEEASATPLVAGAYAFGARDFDLEGAWEAMNRVESVPGTRCQKVVAHPDLDLFLKLGYVPQGDDYNRKRAASFTLEYGMAAFAMAEFSKALGHTAEAAAYMKRAGAWRHLFNPATGYIQSREADGSWFPKDFDPAKGHFIGFTEGNAAQYTWTVRHDMHGLIGAAGGRERARERLDGFFKELNAGPNAAHCWIGNEPCLTIPWAYYWCGTPWRTQAVLDRILKEVWVPGSIPGADDLGELSSWYVWASIGLFPGIPGTDVLLLSAPQFPKIVVQLGNGKKLTIATSGRGRYVKSVSWRGKPIGASWMHAGELSSGGTLTFGLSERAGEPWGTKPEEEPPSFGQGDSSSSLR